MKTKMLFCSVLLSARLQGMETTTDVMQTTLDTGIVTRIPVAIDRVTMVNFPSSISGIEAAFINQEPSLLSRFHMSYQNGSRYFSLRALTPGVRANMNVVIGREIYALEFVESNQPIYLVEFTRGAGATSSKNSAHLPPPSRPPKTLTGSRRKIRRPPAPFKSPGRTRSGSRAATRCGWARCSDSKLTTR
jgi:hypothetical protein